MTTGISTPKEIRSLFSAAKKRPVNFGLCLGKTPEETVLTMHRTKSPTSLKSIARKAGTTSKLAYGSAFVEGREIQLTCEGSIPPSLAKKFRNYLKLIKFSRKVIVLDLNGKVIEADSDGDEEQEEPANPDQEKWVRRSKRIKPEIAKALKGGKVDASTLRTWWSSAEGAASEDDFVTALKILKRIADLLSGKIKSPNAPESSGKPSPKDPLAAKWVTVERTMLPRLKSVFDANAVDLDPIRKIWSFATGKAKKSEFKSALAAAAKLDTELVKAEKAAKAAPEAPGKEAVSDKVSQIESAQAIIKEAEGLAKALKAALKILPGQVDKVKSLMADLKSKANTADISGAQDALKDLKSFLKSADEKKGLLDSAQEQAEMHRGTMVTFRQQQEKAFGAKMPADIAKAIKEIEGLLKTEKLLEPAEIDTAVDAAGDKMQALEKLAREIMADQRRYDQDLARTKSRIETLNAHDQKDAPVVGKLIVKLDKTLADAESKAKDYDFVAAGLLLADTVELCAEAETKARST